MKYLRLVRVTDHNGATLGVLTINDKAEMLTLEDPWQLNERNVSCIPEGRYNITNTIALSLVRHILWKMCLREVIS